MYTVTVIICSRCINTRVRESVTDLIAKICLSVNYIQMYKILSYLIII